MKFKVCFAIVFMLFICKLKAVQLRENVELKSKMEIINIDSLMQSILSDSYPTNNISSKQNDVTFSQLARIALFKPIDKSIISKSDSTAVDSLLHGTTLVNIPPVTIDSLLLYGNPFFIDLIYKDLPSNIKNNSLKDIRSLCYDQKSQNNPSENKNELTDQNVDQIITELRSDARDQISRTALNLYIMNFDELPDPTVYKNRYIVKRPLSNVQFVDQNEGIYNKHRKIEIKNYQLGPWQYKASSMAQFSESAITPNWYQGGNSNLAVLGILSGQLTYNDQKNIQWDNTAEWRLGFNSVAGDTIHWLSTNDDILRINSKLGIKAGGNFFYSGSVDFSTQFFNSYKGINSLDLKASFLAPFRLNIGVGLDYKYEKIFSLMLSPFSYKYIYVNTVTGIDPNLFGVKTGQNVLSEIGSSLKAIYSYPITHEIQLDSKLSFYTNYQKVEIDWEVVCNMTINRFLSTRISLNPRYDNTVIEKDGSLARVQCKQLLSVGFSHKFY